MTAIDLMDDLRARVENRVQLTTDGHGAYLEAVEGAFGGDVDYAMLVKLVRSGRVEQEPRHALQPRRVHIHQEGSRRR